MKSFLLLTVAFVAACLNGYSQNVPSYVPTDGLVGWWPFNGNANDESGNGNDGTVNGAVLAEDRNGVINSAYSFNGNNQNIVSNPISNSQGLTISLWSMAFTNGGGEMCVQNNPENCTNVSFDFQQGISDQVIGFSHNSNNCSQAGTNVSTVSSANGSISPMNWSHLVGVINTDGSTQLFINSVQVDNSIANSNYNLCPTSNSTLRFGGPWWNGDNQWFIGSLDDIGIWNRALTESEIQQLYEGCNVQGIAINGNNTPAALQPSTYTCTGEAGSTFTWSITNGVITSGQGTNNVNVVWAETGIGSISVQETTSANCTGDLITLDVVVIPTSVNELSAPEISIYPNPASNRLSIAPDASFYGKSYTIYNAAGTLVHSGKLVGGVTSLSLEEFANGQYTLHFEGSSPKNFAVVKE